MNPRNAPASNSLMAYQGTRHWSNRRVAANAVLPCGSPAFRTQSTTTVVSRNAFGITHQHVRELIEARGRRISASLLKLKNEFGSSFERPERLPRNPRGQHSLNCCHLLGMEYEASVAKCVRASREDEDGGIRDPL